MRATFACIAVIGVVVVHGAPTTGSGLIADGTVAASRPPGAQVPPAVSAQWIERTPRGKQAVAPKGVQDCAMVYDPTQHRVVLFGGKTETGRLADGLWTFDLAKSAWQEIAIGGPKPAGVKNLSAIYDPVGRRLIVYGGERSLWSFDLQASTWRNLTSADVPRRQLHSAIYDERGKRMVVFGGEDGDRADLYDVWALDLDPGSPTFEKWQNLTVEEGHPPGRVDHMAVYDPPKNRMVIHAGYQKGPRTILSDTWAYVFGDARDKPGRWTRIDAERLAPPVRRKAAGVYDASRNWLIVVGGESDQKIAKKTVYLNDVWALDLTADSWIFVMPGEAGPVPRIAHQTVYDASAQSVILYGGLSENEHVVPHDVWELRLQVKSSPGGEPRH